MSNARKKRAVEVNFKQVLKALVDTENMFPAGYIHKLSDLQPQQVKEVQAIWAQIPLERRRALLEDMDDFSSSDFLLNYTPIARLALDDLDGVVRMFAVRILTADEEPANAPVFLKLMADDPDETVRAAAALAFSPLVYAGEMEELPAELLRKIEEALLAKFHSTDSDEVRRRALEGLGYSSRPELPGLISTAFENGKQNWVISALFAMGRSASEEWAPQVLASLQDQRPLVRAEAATAAGEMELTSAVQGLLGLLDDASLEVRSACIWSLSQIGGEGVRESLEKLLNECEDDDEVELIEEALENLDFNEEFLPKLFDLADEDALELEDDDGDEPPLRPAGSKNRRDN